MIRPCPSCDVGEVRYDPAGLVSSRLAPARVQTAHLSLLLRPHKQSPESVRASIMLLVFFDSVQRILL